MGLFRIYIDEVGNHDMRHTDNPNERFLSLSGIIIESEHNAKRQFISRDPDELVIFHRKEILRCVGPFAVLRDLKVRSAFNQALVDALRRWEYKVITVVIDKREHFNRYQVWRHQPYHYCLEVLLERFLLFLRSGNNRGDVMVESRGGNEDMKLKDSYSRLYRNGSDYIPAELWQSHMTSKELKVKSKKDNISGLQLADLLAYPSRRQILQENCLVTPDRETFSDQIAELLDQEKYLRSFRKHN